MNSLLSLMPGDRPVSRLAMAWALAALLPAFALVLVLVLITGTGQGAAHAAPPATAPTPPNRARKGDSGTRDGVGGTGSANTVATKSVISSYGSSANTSISLAPAAPLPLSPSAPALTVSVPSKGTGNNARNGKAGSASAPAAAITASSFEKEVVGTSERFLRPSPNMARALERELNSEKFQEILFQSLGLRLVAPGTQPHRFVVALEQGTNSPLAFRLSMKTKRYTNVQMDSIFRLAMNYLQRRMEGHSLEFSLASTTALGDPTPMQRDTMTTALLRQYPWLPDTWLRVVDEDGRGDMVQYALVDGGYGWHFTVFKSQGRFVVEAEMRDALEVNNAYQKLFAEARNAARDNLVRQGINTGSKNWADFYAIELKTVLRVKYNLDWKSPADIAALYVNQH
ncbi:MAG: hypothetical protein ACAI35_27305 [Candidatus Methylacidiphilales bacterium]|nr:hypothetical protein [Candidatus Methylacidiphilales bacterium]